MWQEFLKTVLREKQVSVVFLFTLGLQSCNKIIFYSLFPQMHEYLNYDSKTST